MNTTRPSIDDILTTFFSEVLELQTGVARKRIEAVERRLRACIEAEGDRMLTAADYDILTAERIFQPDAAIARTMHAENLLWVLTAFLLPPWRVSEPLALRTQLQLIDDQPHRVRRAGVRRVHEPPAAAHPGGTCDGPAPAEPPEAAKASPPRAPSGVTRIAARWRGGRELASSHAAARYPRRYASCARTDASAAKRTDAGESV